MAVSFERSPWNQGTAKGGAMIPLQPPLDTMLTEVRNSPYLSRDLAVSHQECLYQNSFILTEPGIS